MRRARGGGSRHGSWREATEVLGRGVEHRWSQGAGSPQAPVPPPTGTAPWAAPRKGCTGTVAGGWLTQADLLAPGSSSEALSVLLQTLGACFPARGTRPLCWHLGRPPGGGGCSIQACPCTHLAQPLGRTTSPGSPQHGQVPSAALARPAGGCPAPLPCSPLGGAGFPPGPLGLAEQGGTAGCPAYLPGRALPRSLTAHVRQ